MRSKLLKGIVATPIAAGSICLTMHLTNQANTPLNTVGDLSLEDVPEVKENEIEPEKPPAPPTPPPAPQPSQESVETESGSSGEKATSGGGGPTKSKKEQGDTSPEENIEEVLRSRIKLIDDKSDIWIKSAGSFSTGYEVISKFQELSFILELFKQKQQQQNRAKEE